MIEADNASAGERGLFKNFQIGTPGCRQVGAQPHECRISSLFLAQTANSLFSVRQRVKRVNTFLSFMSIGRVLCTSEIVPPVGFQVTFSS